MESQNNEHHPKRFALFMHQTSGHSCIIKVSNTFDYILKPRDINEQKFYETVHINQPKNFISFLPKYYGVYELSEYELKLFEELAQKFIVKKLKFTIKRTLGRSGTWFCYFEGQKQNA